MPETPRPPPQPRPGPRSGQTYLDVDARTLPVRAETGAHARHVHARAAALDARGVRAHPVARAHRRGVEVRRHDVVVVEARVVAQPAGEHVGCAPTLSR